MADTKGNQEAVSKHSKNIQTLASSAAGLIGSTVGKMILHPIDTVKAKL